MRWPNPFQQKILGWKENCSEIGDSEPSYLAVFRYYYGMTFITREHIFNLILNNFQHATNLTILHLETVPMKVLL